MSDSYPKDGPGIWSVNIQLYTQNSWVCKLLADEYLFREHEC